MDYTVILVIVVFVVSIWNTSIGATGGITFAAMAMILPPFAVIPIHAMVESASSVARAIALRDFVSWQFVPPFIVGGLVGCLVGVPLMDLDLISEQALQVILGMTILAATWIPVNHLIKSSGRKIGLFGGLGTTFLTLFIGATSSLVSALVLRNCPDQRALIGTASACMVFQHGVKILIFGLFGFSFSVYAPLIVSLLIASILGTWVGRKVLIKASQDITRPIFKGIVTMLGIYIAGQGLQADQFLAKWSSQAWAGELTSQRPAIEKAPGDVDVVDHEGDKAGQGRPLKADDVDLSEQLEAARSRLKEADSKIATLIIERDNYAAHAAWNQQRIDDLEEVQKASKTRTTQPTASNDPFLAETSQQQHMLNETRAKAGQEGLAARLEATEAVLAIIDQQARQTTAERDTLAAKEEAQNKRITSLERELAAARALIEQRDLASD